MNKKLFLFLFVLFSIVSVVFVVLPKTQKSKTKNIVEAKYIEVYEKIGEKNFNKHRINNKTTALDLLKKTAVVKLNGNGNTAFVTGINSVLAEPSKKQFWAFYVNGKPSALGAGSYNLQNNDKIEWKLELWQ